jgi:hypothetical protein
VILLELYLRGGLHVIPRIPISPVIDISLLFARIGIRYKKDAAAGLDKPKYMTLPRIFAFGM